MYDRKMKLMTSIHILIERKTKLLHLQVLIEIIESFVALSLSHLCYYKCQLMQVIINITLLLWELFFFCLLNYFSPSSVVIYLPVIRVYFVCLCIRICLKDNSSFHVCHLVREKNEHVCEKKTDATSHYFHDHFFSFSLMRQVVSEVDLSIYDNLILISQ